VHYLAQPGPTLLDRFAWLIAGLRHYVGEIYMRDRSALPLTALVHGRLRRLAERFAALVARVEAGTVRPVRVRVAPRAARVALPAALPRGFGWLSRLMPEGIPTRSTWSNGCCPRRRWWHCWRRCRKRVGRCGRCYG